VKVVITGGGTGGHIFPGVAVAQALGRSTPGVDILFLGGSRGLEATAVPAEGYAFAPVPARGLLGKRWLAVPVVLWTTMRGVAVSYRRLSEFDPDVVFATGGYVSGAVAVAARLLRKPVILHEQNSVPGLTNRLLSRIAHEVHLGLPAARRHFPKRRHLRLSGSPIREAVLRGDPERGREEFDLDPGRATVLVLGGSQGARSINRASVAAIRALRRRRDLQFILQTGRRDHGWAQRRLRGLRDQVRIRSFIQNMGEAYAVADLIVARAGAMTLAELTACGKPSILVPFPHATHNHQEANARSLVDAGAASMILDRQLKGQLLASTIAKLIDTPRKLREMSHNALTLARPDAAEKIAAAVARFGGGNGDSGADAGRPVARRATRGKEPRIRGESTRSAKPKRRSRASRGGGRRSQ